MAKRDAASRAGELRFTRRIYPGTAAGKAARIRRTSPSTVTITRNHPREGLWGMARGDWGCPRPARALGGVGAAGAGRGARRSRTAGAGRLVRDLGPRVRRGRAAAARRRLTTSALGSSLIPSLSAADARLRSITGISAYSPQPRRPHGRRSAPTAAPPCSAAAIGLTHGITIFGRIPWSEPGSRRPATSIPTTADAGRHAGRRPAGRVLPGVRRLAQHAERADRGRRLRRRPCAQGPRADATLADGTALRDDLFGLLADPATASPFVPDGHQRGRRRDHAAGRHAADHARGRLRCRAASARRPTLPTATPPPPTCSSA